MHSRQNMLGITNRSRVAQIALAAACALLAGSAFAQTAVDVDASASAQTGTQAEGKAAERDGRYCMRETGSHIAALRRADTKAERERCVASNGRVYSREDLDSTGRVDIGDALRALDPSIR